MQEPITQEHGTGCGVACVAFVLGISYQKALGLFKNPQHAWEGKGYYCKDIIEALKKAGLDYSYKQITELPLTIKPGIIVFTEPSKNYPRGHYLAQTKDNKWMNPWINFPHIAPAKSGFQDKLPDKPIWIINQCNRS